MAIPKKDVSLVSWGPNFDAKVNLDPGCLFVTPGQAAAFRSAYLAFVAAYNAVAMAREAGMRPSPSRAPRTTARPRSSASGELYGIVQDSNAVSAADKVDVGVVVRKTSPSPVPRRPPRRGSRSSPPPGTR